MAQVSWFLSDAGATEYLEAAPYGPAPAGAVTGAPPFSDGLVIDLTAAAAGHTSALACVDGTCFALPDSGATTCSLVIQPLPAVSHAIVKTLDGTLMPGGGTLVFVYRNIDLSSASALARTAFAAAPSVGIDQYTRADDFAQSNDAYQVSSGSPMGTVATSASGTRQLTFEIFFVVGGSFTRTPYAANQPQYARAAELLGVGASTRRLDPATFYHTIAQSTAGAIAPPAAGHVLASLVSTRILLEVRDAWDDPFTGTFSYGVGNATPADTQVPSTQRGIVVLAESPGSTVDFTVLAANYVVTALPSGSTSLTGFTQSATAPAHVAVQLLFLSDPAATTNDPQHDWFVPNIDGYPNYTTGNRITPIRDGVRELPDATPRMPKRIRERTGFFPQLAHSFGELSAPTHFAFVAGWSFDGDINLIPETDGTSVFQLATAPSAQGAMFWLLLWSGPIVTPNTTQPIRDAMAALNSPNLSFCADPTAHGITGSYHQKIQIISGSNGMYAYCGGLDVYHDRRDSPRHNAADPFHDVTCKVEGPAVGDLYNVFTERWKNAMRFASLTLNPSASPPAPPALAPAGTGDIYVQVARTYATPRQISSPPYPFGPSTVPLQAFIRAIGQAKKFIYIEDQYLTPFDGEDTAGASDDGVGVTKALRAALSRIDYLIFVVPNHTDQPQNRYRRNLFISALKAVAPAKVFTFYLARAAKDYHATVGEEVATYSSSDPSFVQTLFGLGTQGPSGNSGGPDQPYEIYVHTKTWIVDDIAFKIGSANSCRRSCTNDGECDIVCVDGALRNGARRAARQFRLDLWGEHLNLNGAASSRLEDYKLALQYWLYPPDGARVMPYQESVEVDRKWLNALPWSLVDPDGR